MSNVVYKVCDTVHWDSESKVSSSLTDLRRNETNRFNVKVVFILVYWVFKKGLVLCYERR